ncbi:MAG: hypothetical protein HKP01_00795, partial [Gemmatimonadetes bacterium]|nr:hypothetical protein [Gemmatimonadota bacterium]
MEVQNPPEQRQDVVAANGLSRELESRFRDCRLKRPFRRSAYDPGDVLEYGVTGVFPKVPARVRALVERYVGGGFAGQVYRVKVLEIVPVSILPVVESAELAAGSDAVGDVGLVEGRTYAVKILRPRSRFARGFRNLLYFLGYQAHFGAEVLPSAVRAGVLWQKLIRRAMAHETGDEAAVCDTYATFYDRELQSFGEINEWIDGRIWKFEADDRIFSRWDFEDSPPVDHSSPEYVHKKRFMKGLVNLLHRMGAGELARQYEWWTGKSTPNVLKRLSGEGSPRAGLTAVDFRAGLTLLPFLPMSPADIILIVRGLFRGRLVQFDRCDMTRLRSFVEQSRAFADLQPAVDELVSQTASYRASQPDVTHHHVRLLFSRRLRASVRRGAIRSWLSRGWLDDRGADLLGSRPLLWPVLWTVSWIPWLGRFCVSIWGNASSRRHLRLCWTDADYRGRALLGSRIETLIRWCRDGRAGAARAARLVDRPLAYWLERLTAGWLPAAWHRFVTDWAWAGEQIRDKVSFTLSFLRKPLFREQVLLDEVRRGREEGMLTASETSRIESQIKDPFMQKYLKFLAVHL